VAARETPATRAARAAGIEFTLHEYEHDPRADSFALEAAEALGLDADRVFKTLVVDRDGDLAVCIVPAAEKLHLQKVTGYVAGGISPLGQRRPLPTFVDEWAMVHDTVFVSAGRRGLEIELAPGDLVELTGAQVTQLT
jgi:Cys-tRNA(Pro)/Cys-tRNA(Cys) deacylase